MTDLPQTAVPPQVAAALTALVQALAPAAPSPSAPATGQPKAVPTVSEAMPPHTGPTREAPPRFRLRATLAESFADPRPTLQDGVLDAIPAARPADTVPQTVDHGGHGRHARGEQRGGTRTVPGPG
jgi:hypothetical protein